MNAMQKERVRSNMRRLPRHYERLLRESRLFEIMPYSMFFVSLAPDEYTRHNQRVGRLIQEQEPHLLEEMVKQDLTHLRAREGVTARKARTFFFMKYGLANKTTLRILGRTTMSDRARKGISA